MSFFYEIGPNWPRPGKTPFKKHSLIRDKFNFTDFLVFITNFDFKMCKLKQKILKLFNLPGNGSWVLLKYNYRDVFRTRSDFWDGAFSKNISQLKPVICFCRNLRLGCLTGLLCAPIHNFKAVFLIQFFSFSFVSSSTQGIVSLWK